MNTFIRSITTLITLFVLLNACATQPTAEQPETMASEEAASNTGETVATTGDCEDGFRLVEHEFGTTCIPAQPERIATNVETLVTNLLLLGIQPLTGPEDQAGWNAPYTSLFPDNVSIEDITDSGMTESTNLETLLLADPDLIITYEYSGETYYDDFSEIAPTIIVERGENSDWRERFAREATYVGRETEATEVISRYEAALEELKGFTDVDIAFVRRPEQGTFRLDAEGSFPASVMEDAGLNTVTAPEGVGEFDGSTISNISEEHLDILTDAELIVTPDWRAAGFSEEPDLIGLSEFALWETLPAVQAEQVLVVPGPVYNGGNYAAAQLLVEAIAEAVATFESVQSAQAVDTCDDGFRPFAHAAGETCVPENPQRIVTTQDQNALLPLLELDVKPIGSTGLLQTDGTHIFRRVADFDTADIEFVGDYGEPNLESIAALQPDLIIGSPFQSDIYDSLSAIAPTVLIDVHERALDEALLDFAELVNATEQAETLKAEYEAHVAELLETLGDRREQTTVSIITPGGESGQFYNEAGSQATGTVVQALDLLRPIPEQGPEPDREYRSLELLDEHDADAMIIVSYTGEEQDPLFDEFVNSPILNALDVAQAEQVYIIDGLSVVGAGWSKMNTFIGELERILLDPRLDVDIVQE
ncbi:MAG: ABC transporter substrate-binding protein [Chloroflexota bacterium]